MSNFQCYSDNSGGSQPWRWRLLAGNGEMIAVGSEGYASKANVVRAIATVREKMPGAPIVKDESADDTDTGNRFEYYQDRAGEWRFRFRVGNNQNMAKSEGYSSEAGVIRGAENVRKEAGRAEVVVAKTEKIKTVIDGDTLETDSGQRIRLWDVEVPRVSDPAYDLAREKLQSLLSGGREKWRPVPIRYRFCFTPQPKPVRGVWVTLKALSLGRIIAEITVNGKSVNEQMKKFIAKSLTKTARAK